MEILEWCYTENYNSFDYWFYLIKTDEELYPRFRIVYKEWLN